MEIVNSIGDNIIKILQELSRQMGLAIDWTGVNVLPYIQDLIIRYANYIFYKNLITAIITFVVILACVLTLIFSTKYIIKFHKDNIEYINVSDNAVILMVTVWIVLPVLILLSTVIFKQSVDNAIKAKVVPEAVVYEYITEQYKINNIRL